MTPDKSPQVGAFLRPVGNYQYCLRVVKVSRPSKERPNGCIEFERWGMDKNTPVRDTHRDRSWISSLVPALPGVWRDQWEFDTPRWYCCPLYYRQMHTGPQGQMSLI